MRIKRSPSHSKGDHSRSANNPNNSNEVFDDLPVEVRMAKVNVQKAGSNLEWARKELENCIKTYYGLKLLGKAHTPSQDKANMKKAYIADSRCTECVRGIIGLFDNKFNLFQSTGPHYCKNGLELLDAKLFSGKVMKSHTIIEMDPAVIAGDISRE